MVMLTQNNLVDGLDVENECGIMTGKRHVKFTNLLTYTQSHGIQCSILELLVFFMATAISLEGVVMQLNSCIISVVV